LFLAPEAPYPLTGGGALRSASLLKYLADRYEVDVIVFRQPGAPDPVQQLPAGLARRICVIDLPPTGSSPAARGARNAVRLLRRIPPLVDRFSGFDTQIAAALAGQKYDVGMIEHFWCAAYWRQIAPFCAYTVLDLHNVESVLHARCAEADGGAEAFAHHVFARAALKLERACLRHFSQILTASECDANLALERAPHARVTVYPNAIPLPPLPSVEHEHAVVFSGNLEYHPNQSAVRFFRKQIWPRLRERWPKLVWRLVGKNPHAVRPWTAGDPRIDVRGPVPDAIEELARSQVAVVPILAGSGTRLKILEAWAAGLPVVSTRLGAEGLPVEDGRNVLLADTGAAFGETVSRLLESRQLCEQIGWAGRQLLENQFTWEKAWETLQF
jgi:glycosyltransferase involved in cell wall biosynthesis